MHKLLWLLSLVFLCGCGNVDITYHENTPPEVLEEMAGYPTQGYAWREWDPVRFRWDCDIWLVSRELISSEDCWVKLLEHEERHCEDGSYHPNTPEGSAIECFN